MVTIVCDSGPLISFSDTCLINVLKLLKENGAQFLIPPSVQREIVDAPIKVNRYAFSAVRLHKAIDDGLLKLVQVDENLVNRITNSANSIFSIKNKKLKLIHAGEAACLAAYREYGCSALAIDERTTRLLVEAPDLLREDISVQYGGRILVDQNSLTEFIMLTKGINIVRSPELLAAAAKRGYFNSFGKHAEQAFHAAIYALKNAGCSISDKDVNDYQSIRL